MLLKNRNIAFVLGILLFWAAPYSAAQECTLVGIELAKAPKEFINAPAYNFGSKLTFFVSDTATVTGLATDYQIHQWVTNTGKDLKAAHQKLTMELVKEDYNIAKDTALLNRNDFWVEKGLGFTIKLHSWALPDSSATTMKIKGTFTYTVLVPGEVHKEEITHLAGNFGFNTMSLDFRGNTINLKKVVYGQGEDAYTTFSGSVINKDYSFGIQKLEFLDTQGRVMDELYFGFNNEYHGASTRNRVNLTSTEVIIIYYRKVEIKKTTFEETFTYFRR